MNFVEALSPEYQNFLLIVISAIVVYLGWCTTYVREERHPTAVLIIDSNRRRFIDLQSTTETNARSQSSQSNYSNATEEADLEIDRDETPNDNLEVSTAASLQSIIDEVNDLTISGETSSNYDTSQLHPLEDEIDELLEDIGQRRIIEVMDTSDAGAALRRRHLAFYDNDSNNYEADVSSNRRENLNVHLENDQTDNSHAENCTNENNENENISKTEIKPSVVCNDADQNQLQQQTEVTKEDEFRIKLKYLNDELRLVKGTPNEAIGDFKKRNFTVELAAEKLVRLVFNGHVLQPDTKTLKACGLFDNCVVHCLVHNKKPTMNTEGDGNSAPQNDNNAGQAALGSNSFSDRNSGDITFVYLGLVFIMLAIVSCWYCRFQYGHLFSWYSTTGLVLVTVIFLIIFPVIVLVERGVTT